jgi:sodium-dependent dicarboxylate transporter 2/3/5
MSGCAERRFASPLTNAVALVAVIISETSCNTASASMVVPEILSVGKVMGSAGIILAIAATLGASLGFMLAVSTPPNAIVYGSGTVRILDMVKASIIIDIVGELLVWAVATWLVPAVLTLQGSAKNNGEGEGPCLMPARANRLPHPARKR